MNKYTTLKKTTPFFLSSLLTLLLLCSCEVSETTTFTRLAPAETGIDFVNTTAETDSFNILTNEYIYNGGGVGIGDFNQDGNQDIFLSGNEGPNKLYLNEGNWKFKDITDVANVSGKDRWSGGVTVVDVNGDGKLDIYVCASVTETSPIATTNQLFLNQGNDLEGTPIFQDFAAQYGIADTSHNTQAAWLDYDLDGDLDLFLLVNRMVSNKRPNDFSRKVVDGSGSRTDKLYRQDRAGGQITFTEVGKKTGILFQGFALAATVCDLNRDGMPDLYVSNDYLSNDFAYLNTIDENGNHYFKDIAPDLVKHTSYSAMGNDVVDMNGDGLSDIFAVDMLPADNFRRKMMLAANNYTYFINLKRFGYQPQFVRNTLQVSQGKRIDSLDKLPNYAEVAFQAGIPATDWSWTPMIADFDLDSYRDVIITNGFPRDITDHDFGDFNNETSRYFSVENILPKIPSIKLKNEAFRARPTVDGIPTFERVTNDWGIDVTSFSNGAAYGDLDNDGDLDYVVNNIDDPAHIYRNNTIRSNQETTPNQLVIKAKTGLPSERFMSSEVIVSTGGKRQTFYWHTHRGYLSSHGSDLHVGLGAAERADSVIVRWATSNNWEYFGPFDSGESVEIAPGAGTELPGWSPDYKQKEPFFQSLPSPDFVHEERDFIDFNVQPLLLRRISQQGPGLAVADLDNDGVDNIYISGSLQRDGKLLDAGDFNVATFSSSGNNNATNEPEELGSLFFDADGDGDEDLYVVSGSYEFSLEKGQYQDRFYRNDGDGIFTYLPMALENLPAFSGSCVRAADYDLDGDLDLFVGARVHPHAYPKPVQSYLLINESANGKISFVVDEGANQIIASAENVCDALFTDYNNDGRTDLLVAGEWSPLRLYQNTTSGWQEMTEPLGLSGKNGWWNSLVGGDFDNDGDIDYVAGNYGKNALFQPTEAEPLTAILADVDQNDALDFVPFLHLEDQDGSRRAFTFHNRSDVGKQVNKIKKQFTTHSAFATVSPDYFDTATEKDNYKFTTNFLASVYLENTSDGFVIKELPPSAQAFPIYGMLPFDVNNDDYLDLIMVGNDHGSETGQGFLDAGNGLVLLGDGKGHFFSLTAQESGFSVPGEARALVVMNGKDGPVFVAAQNRGPLVITQPRGGNYTPVPLKESQTIPLKRSSRKVEPYWGSGYLSQSNRVFWRKNE